jgi:hypothetical protein
MGIQAIKGVEVTALPWLPPSGRRRTTRSNAPRTARSVAAATAGGSRAGIDRRSAPGPGGDEAHLDGARALATVDVASERSGDQPALRRMRVPAAGVVAQAMVALVLAEALRSSAGTPD